MRGALGRSLVRIGAMASKETLHVVRDPRTLYLALVMPVLMLLLFGYGVTTDLERIPLGVADLDRSDLSRELARRVVAPGELARAGTAWPEAAERAFRRGDAAAVLVIPAEFGERLSRGERIRLQLLVDGSDALSVNQLLAKAEALVRAQAGPLAEVAPDRARPPLAVKVWTRYNPAGRSALFMVPGLAAFILALTAVLLTTLTVAGEWERGSMEQLFASPVSRLEIVLGKLAPYLLLGMLELLLVVACGAVVFDVPVWGSPPLLIAFGVFFVLGMLGQGLLISVVTRNQLVATQFGLLSALLPSLLLSGMVFPVDAMPRPLRLLSRAIPARYLVHALREILLKGNGLEVLWPDLAALVAFAAAVIALATARFQRRLA